MQTDQPRDPARDARRDPARDARRDQPQPKAERPQPEAERPYGQRLPKALAVPGRAGGRPPTRQARGLRPTGGRTVVAVLGSVAALGGSAGSAAAASMPARSGQQAARATRRADPAPPGELALLGLVFAALTAGAPAIARPLLGRGVTAGDITQAEADAFLARLMSSGQDRAPAYSGPSLPTPAAVTLFQTVFDAIRRQLPVIAKPLVDDALANGSITDAQARRIQQRLVVRAHIRPAGLPAATGLPSGHAEPLFTGRLP